MMKILLTILIIFLVVWAAGVIFYIQHTEKQERIEKQQRERARQQRIAAEKRRQELIKCENVLNWFQQQEYCTVKPFQYNGGKIAGYNISWRIKYSEPAKVIWDGNKRTIVPGKAVDINGSGTWNSDFGTYKQLVELKERFEDQKVTFGPK